MSRPALPLDPSAGPQPVPPVSAAPAAPAAPAVAPATAQATPAPLPDSPLAGQLPAWDLVPAQTFVVRRRPAR